MTARAGIATGAAALASVGADIELGSGGSNDTELALRGRLLAAASFALASGWGEPSIPSKTSVAVSRPSALQTTQIESLGRPEP